MRCTCYPTWLTGTTSELLGRSSAYKNGVTHAVSYLGHRIDGGGLVIHGISTAFRLGASHGLEKGSVIQDAVALHVALERSFNPQGDSRPSISSSIAALRRLLLQRGSTNTETGSWFDKAATVLFYLYLYLPRSLVLTDRCF